MDTENAGWIPGRGVAVHERYFIPGVVLVG